MLEDKEYLNILSQIKNELSYTKHKVIINTNKKLIMMYYRIVQKLKENNHWGNSFIDNLAKRFKNNIPKYKRNVIKKFKIYAKIYYNISK